MPAYFESGFSVREPMWHGLGHVIEDYPGREEAMRLAGHDFIVLETPMFGLAQGDVIKGWKALYRSDNKEVISVQKDSYTVVQNAQLWDIVDLLVAEPNVKYETAGVLKKGSILWVLAKLDEPVVIPGDNTVILPYVLVSTAHDGSAALHAATVSVRVVCWNTYSWAKGEAKNNGTDYSFRHTANVGDRIAMARAALGLARKQHSQFIELLQDLAYRNVSKSGVTEFIERLIPSPPETMISDRVKENVRIERQKVREALLSPTVPDAHRQTAYGLFCAGTEYADHLRAFHNEETYFKRTMMAPSGLKNKIAKLAQSVAY